MATKKNKRQGHYFSPMDLAMAVAQKQTINVDKDSMEAIKIAGVDGKITFSSLVKAKDLIEKFGHKLPNDLGARYMELSADRGSTGAGPGKPPVALGDIKERTITEVTNKKSKKTNLTLSIPMNLYKEHGTKAWVSFEKDRVVVTFKEPAKSTGSVVKKAG